MEKQPVSDPSNNANDVAAFVAVRSDVVPAENGVGLRVSMSRGVSVTYNEASGALKDGKVELTEAEGYSALGFSWTSGKKWMILSVVFAVQVSMNLNAGIYANAVPQIAEEFSVSEQAARVGQAVFLVTYAFGCELWAPWSEELGRRPILQASLFLVNVWQILCALAPNYESLIVGRFLGGLSSAGGSVTLGMVADMWNSDEQQYAVAFIVLSSVGGSIVGPIIGPIIAAHASWRWIFWVQLIVGVAVQIAHFILVPETRTALLLDREAQRLRKNGEEVYGPGELEEKKMTVKEVTTIWTRPFIMFATEPIVLFLSLLSGFSDALIFTFMEAFGLVYSQWGFEGETMAWVFFPVGIAYFIAYISFIPPLRKQRAALKRDPDGVSPESRLWWLLYVVPLEPLGLIGFAWTSLGPPRTHWIAPMIFSGMVGIANYAIYMATIDYMVAAYGPYAASATGGNGFARDFLAGIAAMYSAPFYNNIGTDLHLEWPSTILAIISAIVCIPVYVFYFHGAYFREKSKFAMSLAGAKKQGKDELARVRSTRSGREA